MSDVWYYADEGTPKGPMGLDALEDALSEMQSPGDTLVWRAGFRAWTKASDVSELADRLFKPPPLSPPPIPQRAPEVVSRSPNIEPGLKVEPPPIGGWLLLIAIGQTLGPLRFLVSVGQYYLTLDWNIVERFPAAFVGEALLNIAYFALIMLASSYSTENRASLALFPSMPIVMPLLASAPRPNSAPDPDCPGSGSHNSPSTP